MTVRFWLGFFAAWGTVLYLAGAAITLAQGSAKPPAPVAAPPAAPSCEQQLNEEAFKVGGLMQQLAVAREQLRFATKERDEAKAAIAKAAPAPAPAAPAENK